MVLTDLLHLLADQRAFKRNLQGYHRALVAADEAEKRLAADRATFDEFEKKMRAELSEEAAALQKRRVAVHEAEGALEERHRWIAEKELQWKDLGEPADVISGFRSPEYTALEKARRAHEARTGFDGTAEFPPNVTLTREPNPQGKLPMPQNKQPNRSVPARRIERRALGA